MRIVLLREKHILTKMHVHFALDIILGDHCDRKNQNNYFVQVKPFGGLI